MTTVLIDNYDSFTWNVYQYLSSLGANVKVFRNDKITLDQVIQLNPKNLVISPGPGSPSSNSGISNELIKYYAGKIPILGICLGMQCIYEVYGGTVDQVGQIVHGKTSQLLHDGSGLYKGVPQKVAVTRYHSLAGTFNSLPKDLFITSATDSGVIQGVRHKEYCIEGVQFHPESVLSEQGKIMLLNFLNWEYGTWKQNSIEIPKESLLLFHKNKGEDSFENSKQKTESILLKIVKQRRLDILESSSMPGQTLNDLKSMVELGISPPSIDFYQHLKDHPSSTVVLAEVKRASPSKGDIAPGANAAIQTLHYCNSGAAAISVLTEPKWFKGNLFDLKYSRHVLDKFVKRPCILRKDFIIEPYQVYESRLNGADTLLLIVAILSKKLLKELLVLSRNLGMEPLVEVNNREEMITALEVGAKVIGVNNRDLHTFNVDLNTTSKLADLITEDIILIALSGITCRKDVDSYKGLNVRGVLVGEALMKAKDTKQFIKELSEDNEITSLSNTNSNVKVKICGINSVDAALTAVESGADFIGLIFAKSKRQVEIETAKQIIEEVRNHKKEQYNQLKDKLSLTANWYDLTKYIGEVGQTPNIVGVFQNQSIEEIISISKYLKLDYIQLHGNEAFDLSRLLPIPVIKCFHVDDNFNQELKVTQHNLHSFSLLDTKSDSSANSGGLGIAFDWNIAKQLVNKNNQVPIILAGGLNPDNVVEAINQVKPFAVDVSSGVETDGKKDLVKIKAFIQKVKNVQF